MSRPSKLRSFQEKAEAAGVCMEIGFRTILGVLFSTFFASVGYGVGAQIHPALGILIAAMLIPIAFLLGFFWVEVKFWIRLILKALIE